LIDPTDLGAGEAASAIRSGALSAKILVAACLERIAATDPDLQAWVEVDRAGAEAQAAARDEALTAGVAPGPLHGVPVGIKDIIDVAGLPTRAGAPSFAHRRPGLDAAVVARLRAAGAVITGKTQTTQFAFKDPAPTRNPWSADRTPGGSSSGSAAAVAARHVPAAIGTQTVGSILRPAAFCGVVGWKGDHGAAPLDGIVPLAPSFDHVGPFARSVGDVALLWGVIAGIAGSARPSPAADAGEGPMPRIGVVAELMARAEPGLRAHLDAVVSRLAGAGAEIREARVAGMDDGIAAGLVVLEAEAAATHATWFAAHESSYAPGIAGLVRAGLARRPDEVAEARRAVAAFRDRAVPVLAGLDAIVTPVAPGPAPLRAEGTGDFRACAPWSFIGVPAISLPSGIDDTGLPLALQLVVAPSAGASLLRVAAWCERVLAFGARPGI